MPMATYIYIYCCFVKTKKKHPVRNLSINLQNCFTFMKLEMSNNYIFNVKELLSETLFHLKGL